ncbi:MAG: cell division protein FtsZ [Candidatus Heimdallarchaeota archaeon]|nr:cell division protein FtsZ [Candidatus Heimdallarchaeota archaeon]MCG3257157.1 cell division protein FtsZ [Candidatus Heimdallarchaeota archaeon]MCK4612217.1 cell division protein FtsZ [Candidatus Heimdallarchaeota archaeon]
MDEHYIINIDEEEDNVSNRNEPNTFDSDDTDKELEKLLVNQSGSSDRFSSSSVDSYIQQVLKTNRILAIGVGGAGSNAINNIVTRGGIIGATTVAVNTDARHLLSIQAERKLLIGRELTNGTGAGNDPNIGRAAAEENEEDMRELVRGNDLVFVACGLGKGTGTGAAPYVAKIAQEEGCLVVSVCTLPFASEGQSKMDAALQGLDELNEHSNTVIVVPNEKLLMYAPDFTLWDAFKLADDVLINAVVGLTELIVLPARVNVDFADTKKILSRSGPAVIGVGHGKGENRAIQAITNALSNPLLDIDINSSTGALVNIKANKNISMTEVDTITTMITDQINPKAEFVWGCNIDEVIPDDELSVTVVIAEVKSLYLTKPDEISIEALWRD